MAKAVNGTQNPSDSTSQAIKYRNGIKIIAKVINWNKKTFILGLIELKFFQKYKKNGPIFRF